MILKSNIKLNKGEYLDCLMENETLVVFKNDEKVGEISIDKNNDVEKAFKNGRKPLLVVKDITDEGDYEMFLVRWADLHGHTCYSLLDGLTKIEDKASKTEYVSAITDHGNMFGIVAFHKAMKAENKHAIIGFEGYTENIDGEKKMHHLILLAKNEKGYRNLLKILSLSYENFYYKPQISYEMLEKYSEGIIITSACLGGEVQQNILSGDYEKAKKIAKKYKSIFQDDYYLEIQRHNMGQDEDVVNEGLIRLSRELNIPLVAGIDSHYLNEEDRGIQEILLCSQTDKKIDDKTRMTFDGEGYHIHTADEVDELFYDMPEALNNTLEIAKKCSFELELGNIKMPHFEVPEEHDDDSYLREITLEGFKERLKEKDFTKEEIIERKERIEHELSIIENMGYSGYFLIVWDIIKFAKDRDIYVGPGRGSAVGSYVSYCLNIVDIDPIPYDLLFERFLNPERVSMPDIDTDFCYERREEVIDYMKEKYGERSISRIATFQTFAARSVIREVVKILGKEYSFGDKIAKAIPAKPGMTLEKAYLESPEFKDMYDNDQEIREIIEISKKLEGIPRNTSTHACGVVVSPGETSDHIPEYLVEEERSSQITMSEVEDLGLLKMDILGLKTLTVISHTIDSIRKTLNPSINYDEIPINDPYVYRDISEGKSHGVFQLESVAMRDFMTKLYSDVATKISKIEKKYGVIGLLEPIARKGKEENIEAFKEEMYEFGHELFERLIAGISLYRPGPMDYIPNYLKGLRDPQSIVYLDPKLEPILKPTYGVFVYQEQVSATRFCI